MEGGREGQGGREWREGGREGARGTWHLSSLMLQ
jgi:hypothetical protein